MKSNQFNKGGKMDKDLEIERLREKLGFEIARADLMEYCDCALPYNNLQWALDYIKDNHLSAYVNYYSAKNYLLEALEPKEEFLDLDDKDFKGSLKFNGLFIAIGEKMIQDANLDLRELNLSLDEVSIESDGAHLYLHLGDFEKDFFIEGFENYKDDDLKQEILEKHKVLFDELNLSKELEESLKNKSQVFSEADEEQRKMRSVRR